MTQEKKKISDYVKDKFLESDSIIILMALGLLIISLVAVTSASMNVRTTVGSTFSTFLKQFLIIFSGCFVYAFSLFIYEKKIVQRNIKGIMAIGIGLLLIAYIECKITGDINGNYAWITYGRLSLQPSELIKVFSIMLIAIELGGKNFKADVKPREALRYPILLIVISIGIILLLQKDNGSAVILVIITSICFLIPKNKLYRPLKITILVLIPIAVLIFIFFYTEKGQTVLSAIGMTSVAARFRAVTNPSYQDDATREIFYSLLGISKGGIAGVGIGDSVQKFGYLVSSDADYIFSIIAEETGIIGIVVIFALYVFLILRLFYFAGKIKNESDRIVLVGTAVFFSAHLILNIGGVSGLIPLTGVPLLLLSSGGTSVMAAMGALGISQNAISRYNVAKKEARQKL